MEDYTRECHQKLVREKLNSEKIKLWLAPYTLDGGKRGEVPQDMLKKYSSELGLPETEIEDIFECLRQHALQKLSERDRFQKEGIATLKVKVTGLQITEGGQKQELTMEISLLCSGYDLRKLLSERSSIPCDQLKLISNGCVIKDGATLHQQNVKNGAKVMAMRLSVAEAEAQRQQEQASQVAKTRKAAELLTSKLDTEEDDYDIQIADQSGKPLKLPIEEKKALTLAMTLHEKGRAALKKKEISSALLLFSEADLEFNKCQAQLLNAVDNYAVLCLDIVWCYLCLKNIDQLPDAECRLEKSEKCFIRSYGANNERLMAVKGFTGNEQAQALFTRLHLMQGIVAFHQHRVPDAIRLLNQAEEELKSLQVDPNLITQVMTMGFKEREARLGLRACKGNVERAVEHIMNRRKEKMEVNKRANEERKQRRRAKQFGKTANGEWVNVHNVDMLVGMGFGQGPAAEALRQGNNDVNLALEVLQTHPDIRNMPDPVGTEEIEVSDDLIAQLTSLGFDLEMGRRALKKHGGNVQRAVEELINSGGFISPQTSPNKPSTSEASGGKSPEEIEQIEHDKEALDDLMSDISRDEEDYLNLALTEESEILSEYKALLASIST